jgi:hypothetical protein
MERTPMPKKARKKRSMGKADPRWRSARYLKFVRSLPCVLTGMPADEAHHLIGVGGLGGMGIKAPDWAVMPVTTAAHREIHENPELWPEQWRWVAETMGKAVEAGVLDIPGDIA